MPDAPWLTIIGLGEDAPEGLSGASLAALKAAEIIMGPPRHLALLPHLLAEQIAWPVPFSDGLPVLLSLRGRRVAVLASGDPFWFGAGSTICKELDAGEWTALPGPSTFSLAAARLGWALQHTACFGLHAAPLSRLRPALAPGAQIIVLLRDGEAVTELAEYLTDAGFGASDLHVFEALGGPRARRSDLTARAIGDRSFSHPVCAGILVRGEGAVLTRASGRSDDWFESDGTMTKQPVRALTLSALAPRDGEHLWDIGGGSGSVCIEWLLSHPSLTATTIEPRDARAGRIRANADRLGQDRLQIVTGKAPDALAGLTPPDAVFIGGGLSEELLEWLAGNLAPGTRIVANAVTLQSEAVLVRAQAARGGTLLRAEIARAAPLGNKTGWKAAYPLVQWSAVL